jgi:hypothetical protein
MIALPTTDTQKFARRIPQTFECNPTSAELPDTVLPDELMIDWGGVPNGATASIFLPAADAAQIVATANKLYGAQRLTRTDDHTVSVDAGGVNYIPLPAKPAGRYVGLLVLQLPAGMIEGRRYAVTVRQVSSIAGARLADARGAAALRRYSRRVVGGFQVNVVIRAADALLLSEEHSLAFFRWVLSTLAPTSRWYPVMQRYVDELALRVDSLGGDASGIQASSTGAVSFLSPPGEQTTWRGKIEALSYDRFGDFEGFRLKTDGGTQQIFRSRERHIADVARWAWQERIRVTIFVRKSEPDVPERIDLHAPTNRGE